MQSINNAVGLAIVFKQPTIAWKSVSALRSHFSSDSIWRGEIFPAYRCICMVALGASLVEPKLLLGWSMVCNAGKPIVEMMPLTANRNCAGTSTLMIGPAENVKKFGLHAVSLGGDDKLGWPSVNSARHL